MNKYVYSFYITGSPWLSVKKPWSCNKNLINFPFLIGGSKTFQLITFNCIIITIINTTTIMAPWRFVLSTRDKHHPVIIITIFNSEPAKNWCVQTFAAKKTCYRICLSPLGTFPDCDVRIYTFLCVCVFGECNLTHILIRGLIKMSRYEHTLYRVLLSGLSRGTRNMCYRSNEIKYRPKIQTHSHIPDSHIVNDI